MNIQEIKKLLEMFDSSNSVKLKITNENFEICLEKSGAKAIKAPSVVSSIVNEIPQTTQGASEIDSAQTITESPKETPNTTSNNANNTSREVITSPMVGTFYRAPSPESAPYVNVGDKVKKGQTIAIIEAMKIMNEIEAEFDCKILEILPKDAQNVEFSTELFIVEKL